MKLGLEKSGRLTGESRGEGEGGGQTINEYRLSLCRLFQASLRGSLGLLLMIKILYPPTDFVSSRPEIRSDICTGRALLAYQKTASAAAFRRSSCLHAVTRICEIAITEENGVT